MGIVDEYVTSVYEERKFFAAYPPNLNVELGTYGELRGKTFLPTGHLRNLRNPLQIETSPTALDKNRYRNEFKVRDARATKVGAGANVDVPGVTTVRAAMKVEFTSGFGAYVGLSGMQVVVPKDLTKLGNELVRRAKLQPDEADFWDTKNCVVTHLIRATKVTVMMSRTKGSKIVLQAKAEVPTINLGDADIDFDTLYDDTSEDQFVAQRVDANGCTPFFWLMRINKSFLGGTKAVFDISAGPPAADAAFIPEGPAFDLSTLER